jgi:cyclohexadienyl dehydratase
MEKGDQDWLNYVNFFMDEKEMDGTMYDLEMKYIR